MKNVIKKVIINIIMAIIMMAIGYSVAVAMFSAGFKFNLPKVTISYEKENYDLQLINFAADSKPLVTEAMTK